MLVAYLETLRCMVNELGPQRSFQSSLRYILHTLGQRHGFVRPHLVIFEPHTRSLRLWIADAAASAADVVYEPGVGITGQVFTLGRPVIVERLCESGLFKNKFFSRTAQEMRELAFISVPVMGRTHLTGDGKEVLGVLSVDTPIAAREVLEEQEQFLEVIAGIVGSQVSQQQILAQQWRHGMLPPLSDGQGGLEDRVVVAVSRSMRQVLAQVEQAGGNSDPVFLRGEQGAGKELLAEVMHRAGLRCHMPLMRMDCSAVSVAALEEELFGVQKGTTPQVLQTRKGLIEQAHLGSLYLCGVEMLPDSLQDRLWQVVRTHELYRVGGTQPVPVDVRLICASFADTAALQRILPQFTWVIDVPPLRERRDDIIPLAEEFLRRANKVHGRSVHRISMPAAELLLGHTWPGNAVELKSCIDRAMQVCEEDAIVAWHLPLSVQPATLGEVGMMDFSLAVERFEKELLFHALQKAQGNILEASRQLNTSYRIVHYKIKKYGLSVPKIGSRQS